jgi:acylglycerol lipase
MPTEEVYIRRGLGPKPLFGEAKMVEMFTKTWLPEGKIVATVVFIHGLGEHCSRYEALFSHFNEKGIKVGSFDQRGFGRTVQKSGSKGVTNFETMIKDIQFVSDRTRIEGKPHFVMGHSMGGGLCLQFATRQPQGVIAGVIASAPMIRPGTFTAPMAIEEWAMKNLGRREFLRNVVLPTKIDINNISRDPEQMRIYKEDKLNHGWVIY